MSNLKQRVFDYVNAVRKRPVLAGDERELRALELSAGNAWDGAFAAEHAPVAPFTWEVGVNLLGASPTSERQVLRIPYAAEIVGFYPSIVVQASGGASTPTLDMIDVQLDLEAAAYQTSGQGVMTPSGTRDGTWVTLSALGVQVPRLMGLRLPNGQNDVGFSFRWKLGAGVYKDTLIRVAAFVRKARA